MKKGTFNKNDYIETCKNTLEDTVNFENCSVFSKYDYEDKDKSIGTTLNLCLADNYILKTVIPYLKNTSNIELYDKNRAEQYYGQPMKLSFDVYGSVNYWWILLAINGYFNAVEFKGWTQLIIPTINEIEKIVDKELYINKDIGYIPS